MNAFRVYFTDGTNYATSANGTLDEFTAYMMQTGGIITDENPVTGKETRRTIDHITQEQPAAQSFTATHYKPTDEGINPTGKTETYTAKDRDEATQFALYTHRLHNGSAYANERGVVRCPSCGVITITPTH